MVACGYTYELEYGNTPVEEALFAVFLAGALVYVKRFLS
jgi:hypothetical protein